MADLPPRAPSPTAALPPGDAVPGARPAAGRSGSAWQEWQEAPWGRLRYVVAEANLVRHLGNPTPHPLRVLDLGGGDGGDALRLAARGHHVTIADHAPGMLATAAERSAAAGLTELVSCVEADATALPADLGDAGFDVVLCHNVLPYVADVPGTLASALGALQPGGLLSVMALNRHAAPLKSAVRDLDPAAALAALDSDRARTALFDATLTLHTAEEVTALLDDLGCHGVTHYGIRTFCDHITDDARKYDPAFYADLERLELATTARPPYPHTARLFQLTARKGPSDPAD